MKTALRLARSRLGGWLTGFLFARMSFAIPAKRLLETEALIAFAHPQPAWQVNILIVPKRAIRGPEQVSPADSALLAAVFAAAARLAAEQRLDGYRLIVNAGDYQEVKQLHFHLVSGAARHA